MGNIKNGKFVYKNEDGMKKMHEFYDKTLASLDVPYSEDYFDTSFGKTHCFSLVILKSQGYVQYMAETGSQR